jgi:hypothetical protein
MMFEGRYRRNELIYELRSAIESAKLQEDQKLEAAILEGKINNEDELKAVREENIISSTLDTISGSISSNLVYSLVQERSRQDMIDDLQLIATKAAEERRNREAVEAGRRQREFMRMPMPIDSDSSEGFAGSNNAELIPVSILRDVNRPPTPPPPAVESSESEPEPRPSSSYSKEVLKEVVDSMISSIILQINNPNSKQQSNQEVILRIITYHHFYF